MKYVITIWNYIMTLWIPSGAIIMTSLSIIAHEKSIPEIRQFVHKLVGVVVILEGKNYEIIYYLKLLLNINKTATNLKHYQTYIKMITDYDKSFWGYRCTLSFLELQ